MTLPAGIETVNGRRFYRHPHTGALHPLAATAAFTVKRHGGRAVRTVLTHAASLRDTSRDLWDVRLLACAGAPTELSRATYPTKDAALYAVATHAFLHGMTDIVSHDDDDPGSYRYTATTPGGRAGRNIAEMGPTYFAVMGEPEHD